MEREIRINCATHGTVVLTAEQYADQMSRENALWWCPRCLDEMIETVTRAIADLNQVGVAPLRLEDEIGSLDTRRAAVGVSWDGIYYPCEDSTCSGWVNSNLDDCCPVCGQDQYELYTAGETTNSVEE